MGKNLVFFWFIASVGAVVAGLIWSQVASGAGMAIVLRFFGWISLLLAIGYYSTPSTVAGKIAFGFVGVMVVGIVFKILHYEGGNETIIAGLLGVLITQAFIWFSERKKVQ